MTPRFKTCLMALLDCDQEVSVQFDNGCGVGKDWNASTKKWIFWAQSPSKSSRWFATAAEAVYWLESQVEYV